MTNAHRIVAIAVAVVVAAAVGTIVGSYVNHPSRAMQEGAAFVVAFVFGFAVAGRYWLRRQS